MDGRTLHTGIRSRSSAIVRTTARTPNITPAMTTKGRMAGGKDAANGGIQSKTPADAAKPISNQSGRSFRTSRIFVAVPVVFLATILMDNTGVEELVHNITRNNLFR